VALVDEVRAVETISRHCFRSFEVLPNARIIEGGAVLGVRTEVPMTFFSGVASAAFVGRDVPQQVASILEIFRRNGAHFRWWVTPSSRPHDLSAILSEQGMRHAYDAPGMTADLTSAPLSLPPPRELTIRRVTNRLEMQDWLAVFLTCFDRSVEEGEQWLDAYERLGLGTDSRWLHFVGFVDQRPVATTSLLLCDDALAGIYHVATLPLARGRGVGSAVTRAAMRAARNAGATRAALQATELGLRVYQSLGFVERCTLSMYDWRP
jgi:ribosomal protein S18 acetylase RimI-like enzyme